MAVVHLIYALAIRYDRHPQTTAVNVRVLNENDPIRRESEQLKMGLTDPSELSTLRLVIVPLTRFGKSPFKCQIYEPIGDILG